MTPSKQRLSYCGIHLIGSNTSLLDFFVNMSSLHLLGLHDIPLSLDQFKNSLTKVEEVSMLFNTGTRILESSAYLNSVWPPLCTISRSLGKVLKEGGVGVCGDAVLRYFMCGFSEIFILTCGIAVL